MSQKRRHTDIRVPSHIENKFNEHHIDIVWNELHKRFGFDLKGWKLKFNDYFERRPRTTTKTEAFFHFGNTEIQPVINAILSRNELYPTFTNFITFILKRN